MLKAADFSIPEDGRVSEDARNLIRRLLVTQPDKRLSALQVKSSPEVSFAWGILFIVNLLHLLCCVKPRLLVTQPDRRLSVCRYVKSSPKVSFA